MAGLGRCECSIFHRFFVSLSPLNLLVFARSCYYDTDCAVQKLISSLSESNFEVNVGVLETAHSIFRPWRAEARSDALFTEINYVLERFTQPFLQLFMHTASLLFATPPSANLTQVAQAMVFLVDIFYDLACQDLPPGFEDSHTQFFGAQDGLFLKLLMWDPPQLRGDVSSCVGPAWKIYL